MSLVRVFRDWFPRWRAGDRVFRMAPLYSDIYPWWSRHRYLMDGWVVQVWWFLKGACWHRYDLVEVKTLPPTWNEWNDLMLHAVMAIFVDYYEVESPARWSVESVRKEMAEATDDNYDYERLLASAVEEETIYRWWTVEREQNREAQRLALDAWHTRFEANGGLKSEPTDHPRLNRLVFSGDEDAEQERLFAAHHALEEANDAQDQSMLHRVIEILESLWT